MSSSSNVRTLHYTQPGLKTQLIEVAPESSVLVSKRYHIIENEDKNLKENCLELEEGTRARNRAFQDRLDEVWSQTAGWEARLRTEAREAVETITDLREDYEKLIRNYTNDLLAEIKQTFDIFDLERYPNECKRVDVIEENKDFFVKETVPATIEKQSGEVSRQLKKAYEAFDISKQKEMNREKKFVFKANSHIQYTAQRFEDENKIMTATFFNLEDDIVENERRSARIALHQWDKAMTSVKELRDVNEKEKGIREIEDTDLLDTVIETQQLLQETILEHFGTIGESKEKDYSKLNKRMAKIKSKKDKEEDENENKEQ